MKRTPLAICILLLALVGIFYASAVRHGNFLLPLDIWSEYDPVFQEPGAHAYDNLASDIVMQYLPYRAATGETPGLNFWNPHSLSGMPLFEDIQARSLEATNLLGNLFHIPLQYFFFFSAALAVIFAALSMYLFLRELSLSPAAAVFGSIAFAFSSPMVIWVSYTIGTTFAWLPFLFLCVEKIYHKKKIFLAILSVAVSLLLFAGQPQAAILSLIFVVGYILSKVRGWSGVYAFLRLKLPPPLRVSLEDSLAAPLRLHKRSERHTPHSKTTALIFIFLFLGIGLSAAQTLPALDFIHQSEVFEVGRGQNQGDILTAARDQITHPISTLELLAARLAHRSRLLIQPNAFGTAMDRDYHYPENPLLNNYFETSAYLGLPALALAMLAAGIAVVVRRRKPRITFWVVSALVSVLLFFNLPYANLISLLPILNKVNLGRLTFVFVFSASVLAAHGFEWAGEYASTRLNKKHLLQVITLAAIAILFIDLYANLSPIVSRSDKTLADFGKNSVIKFLQTHPGRVIGIGQPGLNLNIPLLPNQADVHGISDLRGYYVMVPKQFFPFARRYLSRKRNFYFADDIFNRNFINLAGVRYILCERATCASYHDTYPVAFAAGNVEILENTEALPTAYVAYNLKHVVSQDDLFTTMEDPTFSTTNTTLSTDLPEHHSTLPFDAAQATFAHDTFTIHAQAKEAGVLVLTDTFHPGWRATVNGTPREIKKVFGGLKGVGVEAGENTVVFTYRPKLWEVGLGTTLISAAALIVLSIDLRRWNPPLA